MAKTSKAAKSSKAAKTSKAAKSSKAAKTSKAAKSSKGADGRKRRAGRKGEAGKDGGRKESARKIGARLKHMLKVAVPAETGAVVLDRLWSVVMSRRGADPTLSHSARLLSRGPAKVAQKFGEEAVECLIEAVRGDRDSVIAESADVLYHLIVLWVSTGVAPEEVWAELMRREGVSGIAEKASRVPSNLVARVLKTTKIP